MIYEQIPAGLSMVLGHLATRTEGLTISKTPVGRPVDFTYCDIECEYYELALAKIGGTTEENDFTSFLFAKKIPADVITLKLFKNDVEIATISDDTYGTYSPAGTLTAEGNSDSALYVGFVVDWEKVLTVSGVGTYCIVAETVILGSVADFQSHKYRLRTYNDGLADGTVRIKTVQNGNIESNELDYTNMNWEQYIRLQGKLFGKTPEFNTDNYLDSSLKKQQIQDSIVNTYNLESYLLPSGVANKIIYDLFLSNRIFITDYNLINEDVDKCEKFYNNLELYPDTFEEPKWFNKITRRLYNFTFVDKRQNIRKRNF